MKNPGPLPVVDVGSIVAGRGDAASACTIEAACRDSGFFLIAGHGLEPMLDEVWEMTRWFFDLPPAAKRAVARSETNSRGFYDRELTKNTRDMKQVYDFGFKPFPDLADDHQSNRTQDGWNQWPTVPGSDRFRSVMWTYFEACHVVALDLLKVLAANLGAPADELTPDFTPRHSSFLRLNHYPVEDPLAGGEGAASSADTGHMGVHHHTDAGALTLLLQDGVGGLQVRHQGAWIDVEPVPGTIVVNIGDIVQVWSNDRYPAPLHRVVASTASDRYSLPYFLNPVYEATYAPLPQQIGAGRPARYREIHWGHFRHERQHGDYGDYGAEIQISDYRIGEGGPGGPPCSSTRVRG